MIGERTLPMLINPDPLLTLAIVLVSGVAGGALVSSFGLPVVTGNRQ